MAKQPTTILLDEESLKEIIDFKIKSIKRAINAESSKQVQDLRKQVIRDLEVAILSINQAELPLNKK